MEPIMIKKLYALCYNYNMRLFNLDDDLINYLSHKDYTTVKAKVNFFLEIIS
uniref:Uncharacterized protein n=2 Tax=Anguilla anguilla TaxID=7936 RepID=A0A0E9R733_ANGAN